MIFLASAGSSALTLGRAQGVALIGRPLSLNVRVELDAAADAGELCLVADVFHGDTRLERSRVTVALEPPVNGVVTARIRTNTPVDEPVVTVYLQAGCSQRLTRRYVLLSEQPVDAAEPGPVRLAPETVLAVPQPGAARAPAQPVTPRPGLAAVPSGQPAATRTPPRAVPAPRADSSAAPVRTAGEGGAGSRRPGRARLKLDPLDLGPDREPSLRMSGQISAGAPVTPQQRAEAAAYWKALSASPQDIVSDAQRMRALEADLRGLRDAVARNTSGVAELRAQLQEARSERFANPLVYALVLLLLAALALAAWAWRGGRQGRWAGGETPDWWRQVAEDARPSQPPARPKHTDDEPLARRDREPVASPAASPALEPGIAAEFRPSRSDIPEFANSTPGSMRSAKAEEVHDVQQQADFFISLGENERAIEVLRSHINLHPQTSPVAWLDLLAIYHRLHRRDEYEATRAEFESVFNAQAPGFDAYQLESQANGLEAYPLALERITALWSSPKVLDLIETAIFRRPDAHEDRAFSLEAYRELLLLHSIAKELAEAHDEFVQFEPSSGFTDFDSTDIQPLSALQPSQPSQPQPEPEPLALAMPDELLLPSVTAPGTELGIDIDIDQLAPPDDIMQIIGVEPVQGDSAAMLDFNLPELDEPPPQAVARPRKPRRG